MSQQRPNGHSGLKTSDQSTKYDKLLYECDFIVDEPDEEEQYNNGYFDKWMKDILEKESTKDHKKPHAISKITESKNRATKKINIINIPKQPTNDHSNEEQIKFTNLNLNQFVQYLSLKITKDKNMNVTKDTLMFLYNHIQKENNMKLLTRDEKRSKEKIYMQLYNYSKLVIQCLEKDPQKYLSPVIIFANYKRNLHKSNIKRVHYLRKMLNII